MTLRVCMYEYMYGYHLFDMATPHSIQRGEGRLAQLRVRRVRADAAGYNLRHTYTYIHTLKSACAMRYCQLQIAISSSEQDFLRVRMYIFWCAPAPAVSALRKMLPTLKAERRLSSTSTTGFFPPPPLPSPPSSFRPSDWITVVSAAAGDS